MQPVPGIAYLALAANTLDLYFYGWMERSPGDDFVGGMILVPAMACGALRLPILLGAMIYVVTLLYGKRANFYAVHALVVTLVALGVALYAAVTGKGGAFIGGFY